jgi:hypothetical protein
MFRDIGVDRVFIKPLAPNDNSKNQIYLGGDLSVLNVLPSGDLAASTSSSAKPGSPNRQILKAPVRLVWIDDAGTRHPAPRAQLILYPQYPEVRLSGILQGSSANLGYWFDVRRGGRRPERTLVLGTATNGEVFGFLATPDSTMARELESAPRLESYGALTELVFQLADPYAVLFAQLRRIHQSQWIPAKKLGSDGRINPCRGQNCGGYTLEAEFGVIPNGLAEPDFHGWELKTFTVPRFDTITTSTITLMTPEPDGGIYCELGAEHFIRAYGYADRMGRPNRLNFGGVHKYGIAHQLTGLRLELTGYDVESERIQDVAGGIALMTGTTCAASWSFQKLIEHWKRKHERAAYIPNQATSILPRSYWFSASVGVGEGADFRRLIAAFVRGELYYDPGLKLEEADSSTAKAKRRNQFRMKYRAVGDLYGTFRVVNVMDAA